MAPRTNGKEEFHSGKGEVGRADGVGHDELGKPNLSSKGGGDFRKKQQQNLRGGKGRDTTQHWETRRGNGEEKPKKTI